jgi:hypothetical protein
MRKFDNQNSLFDKHLVWQAMYPFCNGSMAAQFYSSGRAYLSAVFGRIIEFISDLFFLFCIGNRSR